MATSIQHCGRTLRLGDVIRVRTGLHSYEGMLKRIFDIQGDLPADLHVETASVGIHRVSAQVPCDERIEIELISSATGHLVLFNADHGCPRVKAMVPDEASGMAWLNDNWPSWRDQPDIQIRAVSALN